MTIQVKEKVQLKLGDKSLTLTRAEAIELIEALQKELGIQPKERTVREYYPWYPNYPFFPYWWQCGSDNSQPVSIPTVWIGDPVKDDTTTGTITVTSSTMDDNEVMTFNASDGTISTLRLVSGE